MRARWRVVVLALVVVLLAPGPAGRAAPTAPVAGAAGIGDPYFPHDGNGGIDVLHYAVRDTYRFSPAWLSGTTTLKVRATEALSSFHLDLLLPASAVAVDGAPARTTRPDRHELVVHPAAPLARGQRFTVTVAYAGDPTAPSYAGESNWLADGSEVVTMNEPHMAPWWFAANDHPADKATFDVAITTDKDLQVVGNGVQAARTVSADGTTATTRWHMAQPMTTYNAFFAAGRYEVARGRSASGIPWTTAISRRLTGDRLTRARAMMRLSGPVTDWLQRELGPYPFSSTGGLVTPLDVGFALENQTRPTYSSIDRTTVVHELAHQWFGDSVSVHRWRDIWLNEGFATYLEHRYDEAHGGRSTRRWLHDAYAAWAGDRAFWSLRLSAPGVDHIWDDAVYLRGAMTLAALRDRIGTTAFRRLLRTWVADHRGGNATTRGFERLAARISGQRLGGFFDAWLTAQTRPARTKANGLD